MKGLTEEYGESAVATPGEKSQKKKIRFLRPYLTSILHSPGHKVPRLEFKLVVTEQFDGHVT